MLGSNEYRGLIDERLRHLRCRLSYFRCMVLPRDGGRCVLCGAWLNQSTMDMDHIVPKSLGGSDDFSNMRATCRHCNRSRGNGQPRRNRKPEPMTPAQGSALMDLLREMAQRFELPSAEE